MAIKALIQFFDHLSEKNAFSTAMLILLIGLGVMFYVFIARFITVLEDNRKDYAIHILSNTKAMHELTIELRNIHIRQNTTNVNSHHYSLDSIPSHK